MVNSSFFAGKNVKKCIYLSWGFHHIPLPGGLFHQSLVGHSLHELLRVGEATRHSHEPRSSNGGGCRVADPMPFHNHNRNIVIFPLPWLIIGGLCFWVVGGLKGMWVPICWPAKAARWRCCQALMGISHWKRMECSVASGHLTKSYWKWPSRNSGFTMIYPLKMVDLSIVMLVYQRVTNNHQQYGI